LNAADEVAVEAFLGGRITFPGIFKVISATLDAHQPSPADCLEAVMDADAWARANARRHVG